MDPGLSLIFDKLNVEQAVTAEFVAGAQAVADIAALKILEGDFGYTDVASGLLKGNQRIVCELTLKDGQVLWDWNGRIGIDYRELDPLYGIRNPEGLIMPPKQRAERV